ncbi:hypothetical protein GALMADRAFT_57688 [Galerina marginata CBS 339.88]|uniref:BTB domain-containing protein n=1 Tax=Galerina marginata (strain CBS 339.88) TaxID=685588 RepID=A0A067TL81_GALM3|nr:hypothetical protein GALMADRAFT_57688 [Galerina marginata CBS 339.88]
MHHALPGALRQSTTDGASPSITSSQKGKTPVLYKSAHKRDGSYYFEDGSCVLLILDTLFNVHRSRLSQDNSSFCTMFSLPQGNNNVEGRSDDNPIVLSGDTPEEFRHFLWALYALPHELGIVTSPSANLTHLIDIARVAHKYAFKNLETWALDAIQEYVNRKPSPILSGMQPYSSPSSASATTDHELELDAEPQSQDTPTLLTHLIRLAQLCQHDRLLSTMIALLRQLMASSVTYAYLAMSLADELDLRVLRGAAYFEVMQKAVVVRGLGVDVLRAPAPVAAAAGTPSNASASSLVLVHDDAQPAETPSSPPPAAPPISRAQQLRLLSGYYRLTSTWDSLRLTPLPFEHSHSCSATWHQQGCTQSWLEFWKEKTRSDAVMGLGMADVLGRLRMVQKDYERWGSATYMHHDCRMVAKRAIGDVVRRVEEALPDYFADPGGWEG